MGEAARKPAERAHAEALRRLVARLAAGTGQGAWTAMVDWAQARLAAAEARLDPAAIAAEVASLPALTELEATL